nr:MAG TPA: hypothetical protein [Caudoviricetes sp.]
MKIHFSKTSCFEVHLRFLKFSFIVLLHIFEEELRVLIVIHFVHDYEACFVFTQQVHII